MKAFSFSTVGIRACLSFMAVSAGLAATACGRGSDSSQASQPPAGATSMQPPDSTAPLIIRGSVVSDSAGKLVLQADTGLVTVTTTEPFHVYARVASSLSQVTQNSFIGVTTVKQPDGSERATEIHLFPEELRGLGEGSRMMTPDTGASASRMTNGSVAGSRMTNGTASSAPAMPSRMSNGNVASTSGSTLVVQYAGGSQTVTVPPNTPVTALVLASKPLVPGTTVAVIARRAGDGSLTADKAIGSAK